MRFLCLTTALLLSLLVAGIESCAASVDSRLLVDAKITSAGSTDSDAARRRLYEASLLLDSKRKSRLFPSTFESDVVTPASLALSLAKTKVNHEEEESASLEDTVRHRRLQPVCAPLNDGTLACAVDGFPSLGFTTFFRDCPPGTTILTDCALCFTFQADSLVDVTTETPLCTICVVCETSVATDCTNLVPEDPCAIRNCMNQCVEGVPYPFPNPPDCAVLPDDNSVYCVVDDVPSEGFVGFFVRCPIDRGIDILRCDRCGIFQEEDALDVDLEDPQCSDCSLCPATNRVAFDCSNIVPDQPCAAQDCDSNCVAGIDPTPVPTEAPPTEAIPTEDPPRVTKTPATTTPAPVEGDAPTALPPLPTTTSASHRTWSKMGRLERLVTFLMIFTLF